MAGRAEAHQVVRRVCAAFGKRDDVVYLFHRGVPSVFQALFTQRMLRRELGADTLPSPAVPFAGGRVALVFFILPVVQLLMRRAEPPVGKFRAALTGAWFFGFIWHGVHLLRAWQKPPRNNPRRLYGSVAIME